MSPTASPLYLILRMICLLHSIPILGLAITIWTNLEQYDSAQVDDNTLSPTGFVVVVSFVYDLERHCSDDNKVGANVLANLLALHDIRNTKSPSRISTLGWIVGLDSLAFIAGVTVVGIIAEMTEAVNTIYIALLAVSGSATSVIPTISIYLEQRSRRLT
jgi:hypothetical protein